MAKRRPHTNYGRAASLLFATSLCRRSEKLRRKRLASCGKLASPGNCPAEIYLTGDGRLTTDGPSGEARSYIYDPRRPIPTLGGRNMLIPGGPRDQRPVQALPNYGLIYRSEVLDCDLTIAGSVDIRLHVQSNCPDTDFVAS